MSVTNALSEIFDRELKRLRSEISLYKSEESLWFTDKEITNSAGNLCLHLIGNLNTFIGATLGKSGYIRDREFEFNGKNVPKDELLRMIDEIVIVVQETVNQVSAEVLKSPYPIEVFQKEMTTEFFLIHLASHLSYHLGQINYHRRLLDA